VLIVPPALIVTVIALSVAVWRLFGDEVGQVGQSNMLQGIIPLLIFGGMVFALLTLWVMLSTRVFMAMVGLTVAAVLGAYMVRSTWLAVYTHPDTPVELLVYTQTSPDVPRYVEYVRELAVNQTRNYRSADDVAGGLSMPVIVSGGDNSLAWPVQWYLRDFQRISWKNGEELREAAPETFETTLPDGSTGLAPVLMLSSSHISAETRSFLEDNYAQPFGGGGVFNWWFPEGDKCSPANRGYKRFYFNSLTSREQVAEAAAPEGKGCIASTLTEEQAQARVQEILPQLSPPWQPFIWPFLSQNRAETFDFLLFRELPGDLRPGSRDMELWVRSDLVGGLGGAAPTGNNTLRLLAQQTIGGVDTFNLPTGIAVDSRGRIYVADTLNHRVQVYNDEGELVRSIGEFGDGEEEFNEPRGLAVDDQNNLYVADTWNARIVKISPSGEWLDTWGGGEQEMGNGRVATITDGSEEQNLDNPLGFFGPRGIAVDSEGRVFIADTGNKRIVVTDDEGDYLYQWGMAGSEPGQFNEPTGIAIDADGLVYVADTWNGRVQVFEQDSEGVVPPLPLMTWRVSGWSANTYDDPSIAASPDGQVYVSIPSRRQVLAATSTGETIVRWGGAGGDMASLQSPSGLAAGPDGDVFVVDRNRAQVLRYTLPELAPE
jgi:DNA-binding beta-propeller fold protein YncE